MEYKVNILDNSYKSFEFISETDKDWTIIPNFEAVKVNPYKKFLNGLGRYNS